jgi:WD repeat-containing protein 89
MKPLIYLQAYTTYTVGEDGHVRAWKMPDEQGMEIDDAGAETTQARIEEKDSKKNRKDRRKEKKEKRKGDGGERYKPY